MRAVGSDIKAGEVVLPAGAVIGAAEVGLLATVGAAKLRVSALLPPCYISTSRYVPCRMQGVRLLLHRLLQKGVHREALLQRASGRRGMHAVGCGSPLREALQQQHWNGRRWVDRRVERSSPAGPQEAAGGSAVHGGRAGGAWGAALGPRTDPGCQPPHAGVRSQHQRLRGPGPGHRAGHR